MKRIFLAACIVANLLLPTITYSHVTKHTTTIVHNTETIKSHETTIHMTTHELNKKESTQTISSKAEKEKPLIASTTHMNTSIAKIFSKEGNRESLDKNQIYNLAKDPSIQGQEAATLSAMILAINNSNNPSKIKFTQAKLQEALNNTKTALYYYYTLAISNINGIRILPEKEKLFGKGSITYKTQIIQNSDDDCYFLSAINSILQTKNGADDIKKMIKPVPGKNNEFNVYFPGDKTPPIEVKLTDAEIGMYSHLTNGGQWLAILSVAESKRRDQMHFDPEKTIQPGYQTQTYRLMTGKKYELYNIPGKLNSESTKWISDQITSALNNNLPIGIETSDHDLSIIGFENGNIIIKNPWGTTGWYDPMNGTSSNSSTKPTSAGPWYYMENGVFSVSIAGVPNGFEQIAYDSHAPANPSASFTPRLPVPTNNAPSPIETPTVVTNAPSVVVAPVSFDASLPITQEITSKHQSKTELYQVTEKKGPVVRCNSAGANLKQCTGN